MDANTLKNAGRLLIIIFFTLICLVAGIQIGIFFNHNIASVSPQKSTATVTTAPLEAPETNQNNYLLIFVDRIEAPRSRLKGVWMVISVPNEHRYTFLPIFPSGNTQFNQGIASQFSLDTDSNMDVRFLNELREYNFFWNNFLLVDDIGVITIYDWIAENSNQVIEAAGSKILSEMAPWEKDPQNSAHQQYILISDLCNGVSHIESQADILQILELSPDHLYTDIGDQLLIYNWDQIKEDPSHFSCQFPTFP